MWKIFLAFALLPLQALAAPAPEKSPERADTEFRASVLEKPKLREIYEAWSNSGIAGINGSASYAISSQHLLRLTGTLALLNGPVGAAWLLANALTDSRAALGSLGDPYRSAAGLFEFARLPRAEQEEILKVDPQFRKWLKKQQDLLESRLPRLTGFACRGNRAEVETSEPKLSLEIERDEIGVFQKANIQDFSSGLRAEYQLEKGLLSRVTVWLKGNDGHETARELTLAQYQYFLAHGPWIYGRQAHKRMRAAFVAALFHANRVEQACADEAADQEAGED